MFNSLSQSDIKTHNQKTKELIEEYKLRIKFVEDRQTLLINNSVRLSEQNPEDFRARVNYRSRWFFYGWKASIRDLTSSNHCGAKIRSAHLPQNYFFTSGMNDIDGYMNSDYEREMSDVMMCKRNDDLLCQMATMKEYIAET